MTTPIASAVISDAVGIVANDAHELAGITYRQLDHWARQGWVRPSVDPGNGRSGRRLYSETDVVRLDLLRHLAMSKINTAQAGPKVSDLTLEFSDQVSVVLWGPVGAKDGYAGLRIVDRRIAVEFLADGGAWVVYDPSGIRARIAQMTGARVADATLTGMRPVQRRSA